MFQMGIDSCASLRKPVVGEAFCGKDCILESLKGERKRLEKEY